MQIKNAVSMIPYGLLSGIVDGQEVRITQLGKCETGKSCFKSQYG